ncbi:MAG: isopeptide-forming domain-containing fimbrial protein, partial [Candidatus Competibacteraceae bacterium]|nr:isopeptide-forming domain-containing fimbrial protein [Candidatus Competibacteraceae bacterium]
GTVTASWNSIPEGSTAQVSFTVTVDGTIAPEETVQNSATVEWESLQTADQGALPVPPNNTLGVERTGNPADTGGAANDYTNTGSDSLTVSAATVIKTVDSIAPGGSAPDITAGDTVTYQLTVTLPEGTTANLSLSDALPAGLSFLNASLDTTGFNGSVSMDPAVPSGTVATGQTVAITFGATTTVVADNNPANNSFSVLVTALVDGTEAANDGLPAVQDKTNTVTLDYTGNSGTIQDSVSVDFAEPELQITKSMTPDTDLDAGEVVTIQLTVTNNGTGTAHDIVVTDVLNDDGLLFDTAAGNVLEGTTPADFSFAYSEPTVTYTGGATTLAAGGTLVFEFTAVVRADVITGSSFTNTAAVDGDSQTGTVTGERASSDTGMDSVTTAGSTAGKTLISTSESWTAGNDVAIGEVLTYRGSFQLPEGLTQADGILITDTLPAGFQFLTGTASIRAVSDTSITADTFALTAWGSHQTSTADHTLRRLDTVCVGDTDSSNGFDPATEWDGFAQDSFGDLGTHSVSCGIPADLLISEYVEGSGSNQALEFFNGTGGSIDLNAGNYIVEIYADGSASATTTINLTGTVVDGATYVLGNNAAVAGITGVADQT